MLNASHTLDSLTDLIFLVIEQLNELGLQSSNLVPFRKQKLVWLMHL